MNGLVCLIQNLIEYLAHDQDVEVTVDRHEMPLHRQMVLKVYSHHFNGFDLILVLLVVLDAEDGVLVHLASLRRKVLVDELDILGQYRICVRVLVDAHVLLNDTLQGLHQELIKIKDISHRRHLGRNFKSEHLHEPECHRLHLESELVAVLKSDRKLPFIFVIVVFLRWFTYYRILSLGSTSRHGRNDRPTSIISVFLGLDLDR